MSHGAVTVSDVGVTPETTALVVTGGVAPETNEAVVPPVTKLVPVTEIGDCM